MTPPGANIYAIFGPGRSGTTWLGSMINAHPDVAYRFEPFTRQKRHPAILKCKSELAQGHLTSETKDALYHHLLRADPITDKPPFFDKSFGMRKTGKLWAWRAARGMPPLRGIYSAFYGPKDGTAVVLKDVASKTASQVIRGSNIPVVYLARHPCGAVASHVAGQRRGKMPSGRVNVFDSLLLKHDPELHSRLEGRLQSMNEYERNAIIWRINVETVMRSVASTERVMFVIYEHLCDDPVAHVAKILNHFGLSFPDGAERYVASFVQSGAPISNALQDRGDKYFSVFRDPKQQRDIWKSRLSKEDQTAIINLVADSKPVQRLAAIGGWW